jgi:hypothetical protein
MLSNPQRDALYEAVRLTFVDGRFGALNEICNFLLCVFLWDSAFVLILRNDRIAQHEIPNLYSFIGLYPAARPCPAVCRRLRF